VKAISINRNKILEILESIASQVRKEFPFVRNIFLFGSLAKAEERGLSDIDLIIVVDKLNKGNFWDRYGKLYDFLASKLEIGFDLIVMSESDLNSRKHSFGVLKRLGF